MLSLLLSFLSGGGLFLGLISLTLEVDWLVFVEEHAVSTKDISFRKLFGGGCKQSRFYFFTPVGKPGLRKCIDRCMDPIRARNSIGRTKPLDRGGAKCCPFVKLRWIGFRRG